jgi:hypothetical protein
MSHSLRASNPAPEIESAQSSVDAPQHTPTRVFVSEQQVALSTAAATSLPPATTRGRRLGTMLIAAIGRIHIALPEPRPHYPPRDPNYLEAARMSRELGHL